MRSNQQHSLPIELNDLSSNMDRIRNTFKSKPAYEPVNTTDAQDEGDAESYHDGSTDEGFVSEYEKTFSWVEYSIFMLLGIAMLWAW